MPWIKVPRDEDGAAHESTDDGLQLVSFIVSNGRLFGNQAGDRNAQVSRRGAIGIEALAESRNNRSRLRSWQNDAFLKRGP